MPELAVSTWSLHRALGAVYREADNTTGARTAEYPYGNGNLDLLALPARLKEKGIRNLEICHFHFPRTDTAYLKELKDTSQQSRIVFQTLLIDAGDITAPDPERRKRETEWVRGWIDVAAEAGARRARVIAGHAQPDPEGQAVHTSIAGFTDLCQYANNRGVQLVTENWYALTMRPENLLAVLDGLHGSLGLCADFGNYSGPTKYDDLEAILPRATSIHAKAEYRSPGQMEETDFRRCLDLSRAAGFSGSYVLIFDGPGDEWSSLAQMAEMVTPYL